MDQPNKLDTLLELKDKLANLEFTIKELTAPKQPTESLYAFVKRQRINISFFSRQIYWTIERIKEAKPYLPFGLSKKQQSLEKFYHKMNKYVFNDSGGCFVILLLILSPFLFLFVLIAYNGNWTPLLMSSLFVVFLGLIYGIGLFNKKRSILKLLKSHYKDVLYLYYAVENEYLKAKNIPPKQP